MVYIAKRTVFTLLRTNLNIYLDRINDLYEDYKAATSDNGFKRLANKIRARTGFRIYLREVKRELRPLFREGF